MACLVAIGILDLLVHIPRIMAVYLFFLNSMYEWVYISGHKYLDSLIILFSLNVTLSTDMK